MKGCLRVDIKLFDSELKVMDVLWKEGDMPAKEIARALTGELGWNVNTTYTLIKRCIKKGAIERARAGLYVPCADTQIGGTGGRDRRAD